MRIKLKDSKRFFDEILKNKGLNLSQFSKVLNTNYSPLKRYRRGELAFPEELFRKVIEYSPNKDYWLKNIEEKEDSWGLKKGGRVSGNKRNMKYVRKFRKITRPNIILNKEFCEFYGALMGDGCICKYPDTKNVERFILTISGNKKLDASYLIYLKELLMNEYNLHSKYYEFAEPSTNRLTITNKDLAVKLNKRFSFPIGEKYGKLRIPSSILKTPWNIKKYVIRGLFDTDGCILANKREGYRYPWVLITSKDKVLLEQIKKMLRQQEYPAYITGKDVCVRGIENLRRWFKDIGSSNTRNLLKYEYFLKNGFLPAGLLK